MQAAVTVPVGDMASQHSLMSHHFGSEKPDMGCSGIGWVRAVSHCTGLFLHLPMAQRLESSFKDPVTSP